MNLKASMIRFPLSFLFFYLFIFFIENVSIMQLNYPRTHKRGDVLRFTCKCTHTGSHRVKDFLIV